VSQDWYSAWVYVDPPFVPTSMLIANIAAHLGRSS
jgi:hypothetical protein